MKQESLKTFLGKFLSFLFQNFEKIQSQNKSLFDIFKNVH
jgi:hypothetical protein